MGKKQEFEICIRAVILKSGKILVCKPKKKDFYYFPGGHLDFGESIKSALCREIKEELGIKVQKFSFIGAVDNVFTEDKIKHHEINLVFEVKVDRITEKSREEYIEFALMDMRRFRKEKILPIALKKALLNWLKNKRIFWATQIYNKSIFYHGNK